MAKKPVVLTADSAAELEKMSQEVAAQVTPEVTVEESPVVEDTPRVVVTSATPAAKELSAVVLAEQQAGRIALEKHRRG